MASMTVSIGVDGYRLHSHFTAGCYDAKGYLPAIGDYNFREHVMTRISQAPDFMSSIAYYVAWQKYWGSEEARLRDNSGIYTL